MLPKHSPKCAGILRPVEREKRLRFPSKGLSNRCPGFALSQDGSKSGFLALLNPKKGAVVLSFCCLQSAHVRQGSDRMKQWTGVIIFMASL